MVIPEWVKDLSSLSGPAIGVLVFMASVSKWGGARFSRAFAKAIATHVDPLVQKVTASVDNLAQSVSDMQRKHDYSTKATQDSLEQIGDQLDRQDERLRDHGERLAALEGPQ